MEQKQDDKPNPGTSQSDPTEVIKEIKEQEMRKNNIIVYAMSQKVTQKMVLKGLNRTEKLSEDLLKYAKKTGRRRIL